MLPLRKVSRRNGETTYHESLKVRSPPLGKAVSDLPIIVYAMRRVKLSRISRRGKTVVESFLQSLDFIFTRFEVVARAARVVNEDAERVFKGCFTV